MNISIVISYITMDDDIDISIDISIDDIVIFIDIFDISMVDIDIYTIIPI
jgi:hypothetical protein